MVIPFQRFNTSILRVYFSYDGGFTWREVEQGFWEFQFAALGSIVTMVQKWRFTDFVRWVWLSVLGVIYRLYMLGTRELCVGVMYRLYMLGTVDGGDVYLCVN